MSLLPGDSIKIIAESLGIPLSDEIAAAMAPDAEYRLREITQEALKFMKHAKRGVLTTEDINSALKLRNVEGLYGFTANQEPLHFCKAVGTTDLFYQDDKEVDLNEVISAPLPSCPLDVTFSVHWLAVEGVQPAIPQNPPLDVINKKRKVPVAERGVEIKPIVKHVLSKELQLYFEKITDALRNGDDAARTNALTSLSSDPGIHPLLPYFSQFVSDEITQNLRNLPLLMSLMRMVQALFRSQHVHPEPYLHQLMPAMLTCVVGKRLSGGAEDHWALRDFAAKLVAYVCTKWGDAYPTLRPRVNKTLIHAFLDPAKPLPTHYGGIRGLTELGASTIELLVLPNIVTYMAALQADLNSDDRERKTDAEKVRSALLKAAATYLRSAIEEGRAVAQKVQHPKADYMEQDTSAPELRILLSNAIQKTSAEVQERYRQMKEVFGEELDAAMQAAPEASQP